MDDFRELVCARLQTLPANYRLSIGECDAMTKEDAVRHVKANDKIGQTIVKINRQYFDLLKSGDLYKILDSDQW